MRLRLICLFTFALLTAAADERWLSITELSDRLGIPVDTLRAWRKNGTGPLGVRLGSGIRSGIRYRLSGVIAWEAGQEQAERDRAAGVA